MGLKQDGARGGTPGFPKGWSCPIPLSWRHAERASLWGWDRAEGTVVASPRAGAAAVAWQLRVSRETRGANLLMSPASLIAAAK